MILSMLLWIGIYIGGLVLHFLTTVMVWGGMGAGWGVVALLSPGFAEMFMFGVAWSKSGGMTPYHYMCLAWVGMMALSSVTAALATKGMDDDAEKEYKQSLDPDEVRILEIEAELANAISERDQLRREIDEKIEALGRPKEDGTPKYAEDARCSRCGQFLDPELDTCAWCHEPRN